MATRSPGQHEEDHVDGCELDFTQSDATPDASLPAATGGVERREPVRRAKAARPTKRRAAGARSTRRPPPKRRPKRK
jgi:hypothetical protein